MSLVPSLIALESSTNPFAQKRLAQIAKILACKDPIPGLIARLIAEGGFSDADEEITDEHFPTTDEPSIEGAEIERYSRFVDWDFVLEDLKKKNRRPATAAELLFYEKARPEKWRSTSIVACGQTWFDECYLERTDPLNYEYELGVGSASATMPGKNLVVVLSIGRGKVELEPTEYGFSEGTGFLSFPLEITSKP